MLVGVDEYPHLAESEQLRGSRNDALLMAELLTGRFQFPSENVQVLVNEAATSAAIRELIEKQLPAGAVALYACGSVEREPAYQDGDRSYGLLTRFLTRVVNETNDLSKLSYGLLAETIPSPDKRGRALIAAGSFHGLTTGSLFQLYNTAEQIIAEEDQSVCWLRVEQVDLTSCTARSATIGRQVARIEPARPADAGNGCRTLS